MTEETQVNNEVLLKEAIGKIGSTGKYQILVIVLMCLVWTQITFSGMINSYVFMNPIFQCKGQITPQLQACEHMNQCKITNDYTATYQIGLFCKLKNYRSTIQSFYPIGCIIGMLGISILSDMKGRKFTFMLAGASGIIGTALILLGSYKQQFSIIMGGQVLAGVAGSSFPIISYTVTGEVCSDKLKQKSVMMYCVVWGLTQMSFLLVSQYFKEWYNYLIWIILFPSFCILVVGSIFLKQTPSFWLLNKNDKKKCQGVIKQMGIVNERKPKQIQKAIQIIQNIELKKKSSFMENMRKLYNHQKYYRIIVCLTFAQMGFNTFYYGVLSSLQKIGYTFAINVFIIGLHQFIGYSVASYFVTGVPRKAGLITVNLITSLIGLSYFFSFIIHNPTLQSLTLSLSTIGFAFSYSFISMINTQSFPYQVQSTAMGLSSGLSQVGRFISPFIVGEMNDRGIHPFVAVSAVLMVLGVFPIFFIPETLKKQKQQ